MILSLRLKLVRMNLVLQAHKTHLDSFIIIIFFQSFFAVCHILPFPSVERQEESKGRLPAIFSMVSHGDHGLPPVMDLSGPLDFIFIIQGETVRPG